MMKGLILCAGRGTRLYPLSYSQPKSLLPVANQPVLQYCIEKLVQIGIREIGIVINPAQTQIQEFVGDGSRFNAAISYIEQTEPLGIAHAVLIAHPFIRSDSFVLFLGDNLLLESLHALKKTFEATRADCAVMLREVDEPKDFGIAEVRHGQILSIEEKPQYPKSNYAVIGAYLFTYEIFESISRLEPSSRGEYEITDAIQNLITRGKKVVHSITNERFSDVGTTDRWLTANRWVLARELGDSVVVGEESLLHNCECIGPVLIGKNCKLTNCVIGPYVSIQDGVEITNCGLIENSILLKDAKLRDISWHIQNSIFGRASQLIATPMMHNGTFIVSDKSCIILPGRRTGGDL